MVTPKMRFKTDSCMDFSEWETKRADELFESITDKNHPEEEVLTIIQGHGTVPRNKSGRNIQYDDKGLIGYKRVQKNDFIIHLRSFEGGLEIANENGIVSPAYIILRGKCDIAPGFYNEYFHTNRFINQNLAKAVEGIRDGRQISFNTFCQLNIPYPSIEEQNKIAALFSTLNTVIANCQSEVDAWEKYKRGVMQQLFNQKVRFKANDGSEYSKWELRRLNDIGFQLTDLIDPQKYPDASFTEYSMPAFDRNQPDIVNGSEMSSTRKILSYPCVLINKLNVRKKRIWAVSTPENNAVCSAEFVPVKPNGLVLEYLHQYALTDKFTAYLMQNSSGSSNSQKRVTPETIMDAIIPYPCLEEQQKIADCLSAFDEVIDKAKQKQEAYKQLKKGLLQQMFV